MSYFLFIVVVFFNFLLVSYKIFIRGVFMIRLANKNDVPQIMELLNQILLVHHHLRPDLFKDRGSKYTFEQLEDIISNPQTPVFVYVDDNNNVLGHCFTIINDVPRSLNLEPRKNLFIDDLCVNKNARGKHIGTKLFNYVKEFAKSQGIYNITLHVWEGNDNAIEFYKKLGFNVQQTTLEVIIK
jgi:ribosomal protein S18 acetylase RimI-like enzyme